MYHDTEEAYYYASDIEQKHLEWTDKILIIWTNTENSLCTIITINNACHKHPINQSVSRRRRHHHRSPLPPT